MDEREKTELINRIISGYIFVGPYILDIPSSRTLVMSDSIYRDYIHQNRFESFIKESELEFILMKNGLWTPYDTTLLSSLPKEIENSKLELYQSLAMPSQQSKIRQKLDLLKIKFNEVMTRRHSFDHFTIEYLATEARERFLFSKIILNKKYKKIKVLPCTIDKIIMEYKKNSITIKSYREIAKSDEWSFIWESSGLKSFRAIGEEQRQLISFTKFYNNIRKHPEAPCDLVIEDDDMLDGWLIHMKREHDREKKEKDVLAKDNNKRKGNEHFIMARTPEDANSVRELNDARAQVIQNRINKMVAEKGVANEYDIPEIRQTATIIRK